MSIGGAPSMSTIANRIGDSAPHSMSEFYSVQFTDGSRSPSGGTISLSHFRNKTIGNPPPPPPSYVAPPSYPSYFQEGCFIPSTPIKLGDGRSVYIGDLVVGDVLEGGIIVNATLQIRNIYKSPFYSIPSKCGNFDIYVTGTHHIKHEGVFMKVGECELSHTSEMVSDVWICLITSNHNIPIGGHTFWDWSDWCDTCEKCTIPQEFFTRKNRLNVL